MIRYKVHRETALLHSPINNFELEEQPIEYRVDPLTGFTSTFHYRTADSPVIFKTDEVVLENLEHNTFKNCFFCPGKIHGYAPKFPSQLFPEGRLTMGEATMFPNLFAQKSHSAVIVLTRKHLPRLYELTPNIFYNALKLAGRYFQKIYHSDKKLRYAEIGQNYLYPSGSSVPHPHIQALASHFPYFLLTVYLKKAKEHYRKYGMNYWEELLLKEKKLKIRYLGSTGTVEWLVPFAPGRHDEINFMVKGKSNFLEFDDTDWEDLSTGLNHVVQAYHARGLSSFNLAIYSAPFNLKLPYFWAGGKIVSRSSVQTYTTSDIWYGPNILHYGFIDRSPEDLATLLRPYFI